MTRFDSNSVIAQICFLPELLTYPIPGLNGETLMSRFTKNATCNETKIKAFHSFFLHLISVDTALQVIHIQLSYIDPSNSVHFWVVKILTILEIFDKAEEKCWCSETTTVDTIVDDNSVQLTKVGIAFVVWGVEISI